MGDVSYNVYNLTGTDGFEVKTENERFTFVRPRYRQNLKFGYFLSCCTVLSSTEEKCTKTRAYVKHDHFQVLL